MAAESQGIVIAGFSLRYPLLQLLETLETASPVEPNEVQTGACENGYSAAIVVLSGFPVVMEKFLALRGDPLRG
jgi:hypothetical protein